MKNKLKQIKLKNKKESGFTLIELLVVLGIITALSVGTLWTLKKSSESDLVLATSTQLNEVNKAFEDYITENKTALLAIPGGRKEITIDDLKNAKFLPANYVNQTPFGGTLKLEVVLSGSTNPVPTGLITTTPWTDDGTATGNPRYDLLGAATRKIGSQAGYSYLVSNYISGLNAGWRVDKGAATGQYSYISNAGQLAVRSYGNTSGLDNIYLRRDGTLPMLGNLDLGFHDINNAVNISANGWIYSNHLAANDATIASLFTNYIRNTGGIDTTQITGVGNSSVANFEYLTARTDVTTKTLNNQADAPKSIDVGTSNSSGAATPGKGIMNVQDLYLRDARGMGSYLSDRLPRYVSKGAYFLPVLPPNAPIPTGFSDSGKDIAEFSIIDNPAYAGDHNYACNYGQARNGITFTGSNSPAATGKIEIIPGLFQHKTYIDFSGTELNNDPSTNIVTGNIDSKVETTPLHVYAEPYGVGKWVLRGGESINGALKLTDLKQHYVLVQVYCDFYNPTTP